MLWECPGGKPKLSIIVWEVASSLTEQSLLGYLTHLPRAGRTAFQCCRTHSGKVEKEGVSPEALGCFSWGGLLFDLIACSACFCWVKPGKERWGIAVPAFLLLIKYCHGAALPAEAQASLRVRLELILPLAFTGFHSALVIQLIFWAWNGTWCRLWIFPAGGIWRSLL